MKFEQLLQIYWSRGFLCGGKLKKFNITLNELFEDTPGLAKRSKRKFIQRFELNRFVKKKNKMFTSLSIEYRKVMNMYLSELTSINSSVFELIKYEMVRLYLIKTFRGRCYALGKPCRGQRTWANASTAYRCNRLIRLFINQVKKNNVVEKKVESLNVKMLKKKIKAKTPKIRMVITKKKKNLWF